MIFCSTKEIKGTSDIDVECLANGDTLDILLEFATIQKTMYKGLQEKAGAVAAGVAMENLCGLYKADTEETGVKIKFAYDYLKSAFDTKN